MYHKTNTTKKRLTDLLEPEFMARLDSLDVMSRKILQGKLHGERRSKRRGQSVEFADHRQYVSGDDLRFIDWNIYGRLEKLFLKEFTPEYEGRVLLLLDASASMGLYGKFDFARKVLAALAYIGINGRDRVVVTAFDGAGVRSVAPRSGISGYCELLEFLGGLQTAGRGGFRAAAEKALPLVSGTGRGRALWISDFWAEPADLQGCMYPVQNGFDVSLVRILGLEESSPGIDGPVELVDSETGQRLMVGGSDESMAAFECSSLEFSAGLEQMVQRHHGQLLPAAVSDHFEAVVLDLVRRAGMVESR